MTGLLLAVTFGCGVVIAGAHVLNRRFIAPPYDVIANLVAFSSATAASLLLKHWLSAGFAALAVLSWLALAWRTWRAWRRREPLAGQSNLADEPAI